MMLRVKFTLKVLGLACAAGLCLGASFTWTGGADPDFDWSHGDNWEESSPGTCLYPCTTNDDATIPYLAAGYTVDLTEEEIDDLTIHASVEFGAVGTDPTLIVDSLTLSATSAAITVEISGATISVE